jgi:hypothetical protein
LAFSTGIGRWAAAMPLPTISIPRVRIFGIAAGAGSGGGLTSDRNSFTEGGRSNIMTFDDPVPSTVWARAGPAQAAARIGRTSRLMTCDRVLDMDALPFKDMIENSGSASPAL